LKRILVTGASGFVGRTLCAHLIRKGWQVNAAIRTAQIEPLPAGIVIHRIADIGPNADWSDAVAGVNAVVHLAARVHVMHETAMQGLELYRHVNTEGTALLARIAARAGVERFIYLSTIKVNGERSTSAPFTETDTPNPVDAYGISKMEAEQRLADISHETGISTVIFRPPLIYGPGVKGNFLRLMQIIRRRIPLPLGSINNARSMLGVDNMVSAIDTALSIARPISGTFLLSDDHDLSTPELIRHISTAMNLAPLMFPCPPAVLLATARIAGKGGEASRMLESLRIDCTKIKKELQWNPPITVDTGIAAAVRWYERQNQLDILDS
jgi:nucleoside-diphosphate-sugar epimerase